VLAYEPAKDVLVALILVCFQRSEVVSRLGRARNTSVEFSHVLTLVTPADIVSVLVANLVDVK